MKSHLMNIGASCFGYLKTKLFGAQIILQNTYHLQWLGCFEKKIGGDFSDGELAYTSFNRALKMVTIWCESGGGAPKRIHPTQKPVALYEWLLTNYAKKGQKVLDTHLGSGSSAIAAHYFGVDFVGCELDKDYFEAAKARFDMATKQLAMSI